MMTEPQNATHDERGEPSEINAYTHTPDGGTIRLAGYDTGDGWVEAAEVVESGAVATLATSERGSMEATKVYNHAIQPFTDDDGEPEVEA